MVLNKETLNRIHKFISQKRVQLDPDLARFTYRISDDEKNVIICYPEISYYESDIGVYAIGSLN